MSKVLSGLSRAVPRVRHRPLDVGFVVDKSELELVSFQQCGLSLSITSHRFPVFTRF